MKKFFVLLLLAVFLLMAGGCGSSGVYEADGLRLTVDWEQCQVSDGQYVYHFSWEETENEERVLITYPNEVQCCIYGMNGTVLALSANQQADMSDYVSPETLYIAINDQRPMSAMVFQGFGGYDILMFIGAAVIIIVGLFVVSDPEVAWTMRFDWMVEHVELTDRALTWIRIYGVCAIVSGIGLIAYTIFSAFQ